MLLVLCLITCTFAASTFAKYTSIKSVQDGATIAKWSVLVGNAQNPTTDMATTDLAFDLFTVSTVGDTDDADNDEADDAEVKNGTTDPIIAPGTQGSFKIYVDNASDVDVTVGLVVNAKIGQTDFSKLTFVIKNANGDNITNNPTITLDYNDDNGTTDESFFTVEWSWAFEGNDDNAYGTANEAGRAVTVTAALTATQVD